VSYATRGGDRLVDAVTVEVGPGEVIGLVGANGSGKTTLMRVMLGLLRPSAGHVALFGESPTRPAALARVGAAIDTPALYPWMTGKAALKSLLGLAGERDDGRSDQALARFGLEDQGHKLVRRYSQGMRKRLALAAASLRDPELLILDEPTNALDPVARTDVHAWIAHERSRGKGFLIATHALSELDDLCDRVLTMDSGRVVDVAQGPPRRQPTLQ
jgi:ABC-2 type transport system ATP-binding protein